MQPSDPLDPSAMPSGDAERVELAMTLSTRAKAAWERGELLTAMLHAADALMLQPNNRTYLDLVDDIAGACPDPLSLTPVASGSVHIATAAVRARIIMQEKKLEEALKILGNVVDVAPDIDYLDWARRWLVPHIIDGIGYTRLMQIIGSPALELVVDVPVPPDPADRRLNNVASAAMIFEALRHRFPSEAPLYWAEATARRRLGNPEKTLELAQLGNQTFPGDPRLAGALMLVLIDSGRLTEALHSARRAVQLEPNNRSPLHDVAWAFADAAQYSDALPLFQELIALEPAYPGADLGADFCRYKTEGDPAARLRLLEHREERPWDSRLESLCNSIDPARYYYNFLPGPGDASAASVENVTGELGAVFRGCGAGARLEFELETSFVESPSVALALDLAIRALGGRSGCLKVTSEEIQVPDPRVNKAEVPYAVWRFTEEGAEPIYPSPEASLQTEISRIAGLVFGEETWGPAVKELGQRLGVSWTPALLGALTAPPPPSKTRSFSSVVWTFRCQVATALVLAHVDPWGPNAVSRAATCSLIYGPTDWTTAAGLIALGWKARNDASVSIEAQEVFAWMRSQIPAQGLTVWEIVLNRVWQGMAGLSAERLADLQAWERDYESTVHLKSKARPPSRRYGGLTLPEYAEFCSDRDQILGQSGLLASDPRAAGTPAPDALVTLCKRFSVPAFNPETGAFYPYIREWQAALSANPGLSQVFADLARDVQLAKQG